MSDMVNQKSVETFESRKKRIADEFYQKVKRAIEENNDSVNENYTKNQSDAGEIVADNADIMNIILRNIPDFKDRYHIQLTCRHFNSLCNNGRSYLPHFEHENSTRDVVHLQTCNDQYINFSNGTVTFCLPIINNDIKKMLNESKIKIETALSRANTLVIKRVPNTYFNIFNGLKPFINIKILSLTIDHLNTETVKFFKVFSSLNPHTLYLTIMNGDKNINYELLISRDDLKIPQSIKHMHYRRGRNFLEVVLNLMKGCVNNQLETLEFPHIGKPNNKNEESLLFKFLRYAKNVKFNETISRQEYSSQHFTDFFSGTKIFMEPKVSLTYQVNIRFFDPEYGRYHDSLARNYASSNEQNNYQNIGVCYKSITDFCLGNILFYDDNTKLSDEEAIAFMKDLLKMKNLRSIQTRFLTFSSSNHFSYFCKGLNRNLDNMKLEKCSGMSIYHMEEIARNCKYLKNLILDQINCETITLKKIFSLFQHLIGLRIYFNNCYNVLKIINDLIKKEENGTFKLTWPEVHFLEIRCAYPNTNEKYILEEVAKYTPRRCGQLFIQYLESLDNDNEYFLRIIIQRSTSACTRFEKSFVKTFLLG